MIYRTSVLHYRIKSSVCCRVFIFYSQATIFKSYTTYTFYLYYIEHILSIYRAHIEHHIQHVAYTHISEVFHSSFNAAVNMDI